MAVRGKQVRIGIEARDHVYFYRDDLTDEERAQYRIGDDGEGAGGGG